MTLSKHKIAKIRKLKREKASYREIKAKTGTSFDAIKKYGEEPQPYPSLSTTAIKPSKKPEIPQDQSDQNLMNIIKQLENNRDHSLKNNPDPDIRRLEKKFIDLEKTQQKQGQTLEIVKKTQETLNNPPLEKQENMAKPVVLPSPPVQIFIVPAPSSDFQQIPKPSLNQTDLSLELTEEKITEDDRDDSSYEALSFFAGLIKVAPQIIQFLKNIEIYKNTGVFPQSTNKLDNHNEKIPNHNKTT